MTTAEQPLSVRGLIPLEGSADMERAIRALRGNLKRLVAVARGTGWSDLDSLGLRALAEDDLDAGPWRYLRLRVRLLRGLGPLRRVLNLKPPQPGDLHTWGGVVAHAHQVLLRAEQLLYPGKVQDTKDCYRAVAALVRLTLQLDPNIADARRAELATLARRCEDQAIAEPEPDPLGAIGELRNLMELASSGQRAAGQAHAHSGIVHGAE